MQTFQNRFGLKRTNCCKSKRHFLTKAHVTSKSRFQITTIGLNGTVDCAYLYKLRKPITQRRSVVKGDRRSVQQSSVDEPGPHHPAQVGRPGNHVTFSDVLEWKSFNRVQGHIEIPPPLLKDHYESSPQKRCLSTLCSVNGIIQPRLVGQE
jgi:hypothetical protein